MNSTITNTGRHSHLPFAGFFFLQNLPRGMLLSVVPLQALALTGNAQSTSILLFAVSAGGILAALGMSAIIRRLGNHSAFLLSCALMVISVFLMSFEHVASFSIGLFCHAFSIAAAEVTTTLYILGKVQRADMTRFEPLRILSTVSALMIGPFLGVYFEARVFHELPFIISGLSVFAAILHFRYLKLHLIVVPVSKTPVTNPLRTLQRYFHQPRLSLAYGLVLARSCWWTMFVIYAPIYATESGLGELTGAAIVSIGTAWTLSVPMWGWAARRYGVRRLLMSGFIATSVLTFSVFLFVGAPMVASALMLFSALGATMLDGVGNVLFYRAVRGRERSEMSSVFVTYRDTGQIVTPGLYAVLLSFFALPVVFFSAAVWMLVSAWYCRYIPRQLR